MKWLKKLFGVAERKWIDRAGVERSSKKQMDEWNSLYGDEAAEDAYRSSCSREGKEPSPDVIRGIYGR